MAWNQPGNNNSGNPWGGPPQGGKNELQELLAKLTGMRGNGDGNLPEGKLAGIVIAALLVIWVIFGFYQLDEQKRAVILRLGAFHDIVGPGFHWNPPFIDTVISENVTQQRPYTTQGAMLTEDENIVDVQVSVQYNIGDLRKFTMGIRKPEHALAEATDSAVRHAVGSSKMDDVLTTGRVKIASDVQDRLQKYLDAYQTGIVVTTVNVEKTQPPSEVQAAFDDVIKAREDEQRVQNEAQTYANTVVPEARGLAKRVFEESLAYRDRVVARAQGEAERFSALHAEYVKAPEVTRQRLYIEAMQEIYANNSKVLIDAKNSNNLLYLPLDQLGRSQGSNSNSTDGTRKPVTPIELEMLSAQEEKGRSNTQNNSRADAERRREAR